jgi:hypothetical protein
MLKVRPGSWTLPRLLSLVVFTENTVLLAGSKAITMFRLGEIAINPGEAPAPKGDVGVRVSLSPFTITRLPKALVEVTPCDTSTRSGKPLGGLVRFDPPHEAKFKLAHRLTINTRIRLFNRQAPNDMKKEDLSAKS